MIRIPFLLLLLILSNSCYASTLQARVRQLTLLPIAYGTNALNVAGRDVIITKARLEKENAWSQDQYMVMWKNKGMWQMVEPENGEGVIRAVPHTGEDSISQVYFFIPKQKEVQALYLLQVTRKYKENPGEKAIAHFVLSVFTPTEDELGLTYFTLLETDDSQASYCNAESAAYHELQIPLVGEEFVCGG